MRPLTGSAAARTPSAQRGSTLFAPARVDVEELASGGMILRSAMPLGPYPRCVGAMVERWAAADAGRLFLAERAAGGDWRRIGYGAGWHAARAIGQAVLDRGLSPERPVLILAENGIDHALLALGAMHVGVPAVPVSTAYARLSQDFAKLRYILDLVRPGLIYVGDPVRYAAALAALDLGGADIVASAPAPGMTAFGALLETRVTPAVGRAYEAVGPDTIAKILFTSGSTDLPKGVINTQRMLCANQQMIAQIWPFLAERPPVIVDWLPWNHTFGANHNFNMVAHHGGALYIDEGKPAPGLIDRTIANLRDVSPTVYFNVPRGYAMLIDHLERDEALRERFFRELRLLFYAGAGLPQSLWSRLDAVARAACGRTLPVISSWGLTETAPLATAVHFDVDRAGIVGIPAPGVELKLAPVADKLEMRVRGPNVTPGYWKRADLTEAAFDEDGWYRTGDTGLFVDPQDPARGLVFDGRIAENFKLSSGTWVNVGALRTTVIAAASPVIEDAVIAGHDRDAIGLLVFPSLAGCRGLCPQLGPDVALSQLVANAAVHDTLREGLRRHNRANPGTSTRIARVLFMAEPPSIDANEITDKGYINQRAVLARRAALVERLYADPPDAEAVVIEF